MRFIAISNHLRVIFPILLSFAEIAEINTRENIICHHKVNKYRCISNKVGGKIVAKQIEV